MTARQLVLLAGPSGSGKSRLAHRSGAVPFRLDDFYLDLDAPDLPRLDGLIDWDDVRTWQPDAAAAALGTLLETGVVEVPSYSLARSRREGEHEVRAPAGAMIVAEGIFAPDLLETCRRQGLPVRGIYLDRPSLLVFVLRLRRDLAQHRKPPPVLVRRGWRLMHLDRALRARCVALGFTPASMRRAERLVVQWQRDGAAV